MTEIPPPLTGPAPQLAFLDLGERLRRRGQLDAALSVVQAGVAHYPTLPEAHDLLARIAADLGDHSGAIAAWQATLECSPGHVGALKGLAYVAFRQGDIATAQDRLEAAAALAPHDAAILGALDRVRVARPATLVEPLPTLGANDARMVLADTQGMRIVGRIGDGQDATADRAAAEASGLVREATRTTRLLGLGDWQEIIVEGPAARAIILPVEETALLLVQRPLTTPVGRLRSLASRGVAAARTWLARGEG
ncbi:MAG: tetratricopeptide repeat protein [Gemmatimonadales bacterium]|nr:tetratricopeptide repeat protein [Gemmatimonadales bacterium]MDZ4389769.1 tetratricopeptide repeat protein [Gemmatimonadales bacterium]